MPPDPPRTAPPSVEVGGRMTGRVIEHAAVADIRFHPGNARRHSEKQLTKLSQSLTEFGWTAPLLVDHDGVLIAGHGRLEAALKLGIETVPIIRLSDFSPAQADAYRLADNRLTDLGGWDYHLLAAELDELRDLGVSLDTTGFDLEEAMRMLAPLDDGESDSGTGGNLGGEPVTAWGDLWILGRHRLMCGEPAEPDDVGVLTDGQVPELVITEASSDRWMGSSWEDSLSAVPASIAYVWTPDVEMERLFDWFVGNGYAVRAHIVMVRGHSAVGAGHYHRRHLGCLYAVRNGVPSNWIGGRDQSTIWREDTTVPANSFLPIDCLERPLSNHKGDVYCPYAGDGSVFIGAERQGRRCYAFEQAPAMCDHIVERWQQFSGETAYQVQP